MRSTNHESPHYVIFFPVFFLGPNIFLSTALSTPSAYVWSEVSIVNSECCIEFNLWHSSLLKIRVGTLNVCASSSNCVLLTNNEQKLILLFDVQYSDSLWAGRSGDRIPVGARFSAPVQTSPGAHPASYTVGTRYFLWGVKQPGCNNDHPPTI